MNRTLTIVLVGAVALVAAQLAWASIPDSKGVIHGCYDNTTPHTLSVVDTATATTCPTGTTALNWNAKGPVGPSNAYAAYHDGAVSIAATGSTTLLTLNLAPGSYLITAKAQIDTNQECAGPAATPCTITKFPTCTLTAGADSDTVSQGTEGPDSNGGGEVDRLAAAMNVVVVHAATASFTASFACTEGTVMVGANTASMETVATYSKLVALKVGHVSNTAE